MHRLVLRALLVIAAIAPSWSFAAQPLRVVATGGRIGYTFHTPATGNTAFRHRSPHKLGGPVSEIQVGFMDWMYTDKTETANADNDVTITHAWLERAATGQTVPLTFSGSRQLVLPMNSTTPYWLSDVVPSSAWTGAALARDEVFWLHARGTIPEGGKIPVGTPATYSGARFVVYPPANDTGGYDTAGAVPAITGATARTEGLPVVFLGRYTGPGHLAVIGIGDSILHGSGDAANPAAVIAGYGFLNRAALDANGANTIATFNLTRHGQTAAAWISPSKQSRQTPFLKFANAVVEEYGTNDLGGGGTGDPAAILARLETIWSTARAQGVQKIVRTLLMPRTTSTDSWSTLAGQTPNVGWEQDGKRDTINTALLAALAAGKVDHIIDSLAILGDPTDDSRWLTNGTAKYVTGDGTHLNPAGNALLAPALRAALLALTVDDYSAWSAGIAWGGTDSSPEADPNADGVNNLLSYAFALSPLVPAAPGNLPAAGLDTTTTGGPWLTLTYRQNVSASDLTCKVQSSTTLNAAWTDLVIDGVTAVTEIANDDPDGDGSAVLHRIRLKLQPEEPRRFLRLHVTR